jgi:hypothetical protein
MQIIESLVNSLCKLYHITDSISPWFSITSFVLFNRVLLTNFLSDSNILTKTSKTAYKSSPTEVDKRSGSFCCKIVESKNRVFVDRIVNVPI